MKNYYDEEISYPYKVSVANSDHRTWRQWDWCCANIAPGTWKETMTLDSSSTFYFINEQDAMLFKLSNSLS